MLLVILMQRPKSEGLGAAFGGGVTENIFGAQTTNVLVKFHRRADWDLLRAHLHLVRLVRAQGRAATPDSAGELLKQQTSAQPSDQ